MLKGFEGHVAHDIAQGITRKPLRLHNHTEKLNIWVISDQYPTRFTEKVQASGLHGLCGLGHYSSTRARRVTAIVERWHPETNSFHYGFGEMTPTLDDVLQLTGLPISGTPVFTEDPRTPVQILVDLLGVTADEAREGIGGRRNSVSLDWLFTNFSVVEEDDTNTRVDCCVRAYLLYVLGCTIFTSKEGCTAPVKVLTLLDDLEGVSGYAWGAAALAILYRELGYATRKTSQQIAGFMVMLEVHLSKLLPILTYNTYIK